MIPNHYLEKAIESLTCVPVSFLLRFINRLARQNGPIDKQDVGYRCYALEQLSRDICTEVHQCRRRDVTDYRYHVVVIKIVDVVVPPMFGKGRGLVLPSSAVQRGCYTFVGLRRVEQED